MSERLHERVTRSYTSPSRSTSLRKPAMRLSPRKITSPQNYRIPPKRLESPDALKSYQHRIQDRLNSQSTTHNVSNLLAVSENRALTYNSPLKPKTKDKDISSSFPSLIPNPNSVVSPRREIPIDLSPIRGKNIISKLKQEMSKIEALDRNKMISKISKKEEPKKSVRFDVSESKKTYEGLDTMKNKTSFLSNSNISVEKIYEELSDIKKMLTLIIKKQEAQDLLLSDILIKHNKLEEDTKTYTIKEEKDKD
ncbi:Fin1p PWA37_001993 [Arxiozyma heterogenica]|uniref:Fin1p n=1 Tax=Arxiozyma heterogenica TaxID=278026 RepID=UPI002EEF06A8